MIRDTYLAEMVSALAHTMRAAPTGVAVQRDHKWGLDAKVPLMHLERFLALRRGLDLIKAVNVMP